MEPTESSMSSSLGKEPTTVIHLRREPFEHGLLLIPSLIFSDAAQTLILLKQKLLESSSNQRVDSATISESLQISVEHARLVIDTLALVLHSDLEPLVAAKLGEIDSVGMDVHDLLLFLYIQSYKRLLPRTHKDSAVVADRIWLRCFNFALNLLTKLTGMSEKALRISIQFLELKGRMRAPLLMEIRLTANSDVEVVIAKVEYIESENLNDLEDVDTCLK
ncbi:hypothetical protein CR513_06722, partial [Mucuna pruriens]